MRFYHRVPMLNDLPGLTYECDECGRLRPIYDRWTDGRRAAPVCGECAGNLNVEKMLDRHEGVRG